MGEYHTAQPFQTYKVCQEIKLANNEDEGDVLGRKLT